MDESSPINKAHIRLKYQYAESTGHLKSKVPFLKRMAFLARLTPLGAIVLLSACDNSADRLHVDARLTGIRIMATVRGGLTHGTRATPDVTVSGVAAGITNQVAYAPVLVGFDSSGNPAIAGLDASLIARAEKMVAQTPLGTVVAWKNPDTGTSASYQGIREGYSKPGIFCREYKVRRSDSEGGHTTSFTIACISSKGNLSAISNSLEPSDGSFREITDYVPGDGEPIISPRRL